MKTLSNAEGRAAMVREPGKVFVAKGPCPTPYRFEPPGFQWLSTGGQWEPAPRSFALYNDHPDFDLGLVPESELLAEKEREKWQHTERPKVDFTMFKYGQPQPAPELPSEISCSIGEAISYIRKGAYGDAHAMFHTALEQTLAEAERRVLAQVKYGAKE